MENEIILEELKSINRKIEEINVRTTHMEKTISLHIQKTEYEFDKIHTLDQQQNDILDKHIEGVLTLKKMYALLEEDFTNRLTNQQKAISSRLRKVEAPQNAIAWIVKVAGGASVIGTAIYGALKAFGIL